MYFLSISHCPLMASVNGGSSTIPSGYLYVCLEDDSSHAIKATNTATRVGLKLSKKLVDHLAEVMGTTYTLPLADGSGTVSVAPANYAISLEQVYSVQLSTLAITTLFTQLADFPNWSDSFVITP